MAGPCCRISCVDLDGPAIKDPGERAVRVPGKGKEGCTSPIIYTSEADEILRQVLEELAVNEAALAGRPINQPEARQKKTLPGAGWKSTAF